MNIFIYEPSILMDRTLRRLFEEKILEAKVTSIKSRKELEIQEYDEDVDIVISGCIISKDWDYRDWLEIGGLSKRRIIFFIEKIHATNFFIIDMNQSLNISVLLKEETDTAHLLEAIFCSIKGQVSRSSYIQTLITKMRKEFQTSEHLLTKLSVREKQYLKLYCETLSPQQIALEMDVTISTVNSFKDKVLLKFNLESVHELIQLCAHDEILRGYFPKPTLI